MDHIPDPSSALERTALPYRVVPPIGAVAALASLGCAVFLARGVAGPVPVAVVLAAGILGIAIALVVPLVAARRLRARAAVARAALEAKNFELDASVAERDTRLAARDAHIEDLDARIAALHGRIAESEARAAALEDRVAVAESAKREVEGIAATIDDHLIVIDAASRVCGRFGAPFETIFDEPARDGETLLEFLRRRLPDAASVAAAYVANLFDASAAERTVRDDNPFTDVPYRVTAADGARSLRAIRFTFRRIVRDGVVERVVVAAQDVTERSRNERDLRESERRASRRFALLVDALAIAGDDLDGFVDAAGDRLAAADAVPRSSPLRERLAATLRAICDVDDDATALRLNAVRDAARELEAGFGALLRSTQVPPTGLIAEAFAGFDAFRADIDDLRTIRQELLEAERAAREADAASADEVVAGVGELARSLGKRAGKPVVVDAAGFDTRALAPDRRLVIKDVLTQLVRNTVAHGIESLEERVAAGKPPVATIAIRTNDEAAEGAFSFTYRDDGRGLDAPEIRRRAVAAGLIAAEDAAGYDDSAVASFIFEPGFTTADSATPGGFRGMGMTLIKRRVVDDSAGELTVNSEPGAFCEFGFDLPGRDAAVPSFAPA